MTKTLLLVVLASAPAAAASNPTALARYFHRQDPEIADLRRRELSYAEIVKVLVIADMSHLPLPDLLARHQSGRPWGSLCVDLGLDPVSVSRRVDGAREDLGVVVARR